MHKIANYSQFVCTQPIWMHIDEIQQYIFKRQSRYTQSIGGTHHVPPLSLSVRLLYCMSIVDKFRLSRRESEQASTPRTCR